MKKMLTMPLAAIACSTTAGVASAQPVPPDYGYDFVTIGDVGNPAYVGNPLTDDGPIKGSGSVGYEYRIARTEVPTEEWVEFSNAILQSGFARQDIPIFPPPRWGGSTRVDPVTNEITISQVPGRENWVVAGITWRAAAVYCNWLHNDKQISIEAFSSGAYDISTFGRDPVTRKYTDQATRSPGARYWIPSLDEWIKAVHYDPDRHGPGPGLESGGYWTFPDGSDTKPITGVPGVGETNADLVEELGESAWQIPIGSYPETQTPWGLLDASGGASELTEDWEFVDNPLLRLIDGASMDVFLSDEQFNPDQLGRFDIPDRPDSPTRVAGLRIASAIPSPGGAVLLVITVAVGGSRRHRTASRR